MSDNYSDDNEFVDQEIDNQPAPTDQYDRVPQQQ